MHQTCRVEANNMADSNATVLQNKLNAVQNLTGDHLVLSYQEICAGQQPMSDFLSSLNLAEQETVYKCCLLLQNDRGAFRWCKKRFVMVLRGIVRIGCTKI